jgi:hypothetical protein
MKEYRLTAWPELASAFQSTGYRRMLNDLSQRYLTLNQLAEVSNLRRKEVRSFLEMLETRGMLVERESMAPESLFWSLRPLSGWLRRALLPSSQSR